MGVFKTKGIMNGVGPTELFYLSGNIYKKKVPEGLNLKLKVTKGFISDQKWL